MVKNRKELNKTIMGQCKKISSQNKYSSEGPKNNHIEQFSNTCNSFFKKNVDNFINNYLKNNYFTISKF